MHNLTAVLVFTLSQRREDTLACDWCGVGVRGPVETPEERAVLFTALVTWCSSWDR